MRRSKMITLTMASALALAVAACGEEPPRDIDSAVFSSVDQCVASTQFDRDDCEDRFEDAREEHLRNAPKFGQKAECEAEYGVGQCESRDGGSIFVPFMMGYFMGGGGHYKPAPVYKSKSGSYKYSTPYGVGSTTTTGKVHVAPRTMAAPSKSSGFTATTTTSRGGFGTSGYSSSS